MGIKVSYMLFSTIMLRNLLTGIAMLVVASPTYAIIIGTSVSTGMEIRYDSTVDATATDTGTTSASVNITGPVTGATASASLALSGLTTESATVDFNIGYDGNGYGGFGYLGQSAGTPNFAEISYDATIDSVLDYLWNFDYLGTNPFGLQIIRIQDGNTTIDQLGNVGFNGHFEGSGTYNLLAGNSYLIRTQFLPNVSGQIGGVSGNLIGSISYNFNGANVPEPSVLALLALGLFGIGAARRRQIR